MNPILINILAVIAGLIIGSIVNTSLINLGPVIFPMEGFDLTDMESLAEAMPFFEPKNFLFPFLGHALGTLIGAFVAAWIAASHNLTLALVIGAFFLIGGIMINYMLPGPLWFTAVDILVAYIPMAWIGGKMGIAAKRTT